MGRIVTALTAVLLIFGMAAAGQHRHVVGDALERKECYILLASMTIMSGFPRTYAARSPVHVPQGNIICVDEVDDRGPGDLWYSVRIKALATLDQSRDMRVWVDSRDLMEYGVTLAY